MTTTSAIKSRLFEQAGTLRILDGNTITLGQLTFEAEFYTEVLTLEELVYAVTLSRSLSLPFVIIGNGFSFDENVETIDGLVIKNNCRKYAMLSMRGKTGNIPAIEERYVMAESGVGLNQLVRFTLEEGFGGLEYFLGASGTIGDALLRHEVYEKAQDFLVSHIFTIRLLTAEGEVVEVGAESFLTPLEENILEKKGVIPLSVVFSLRLGDKQALWKKGTQAAFERNQKDLLDPLKSNFKL